VSRSVDASKPRSISAGERVWHVAAALLLLAYGGAGLYYDDIYIPGKHSRGVHLHGTAAWVMFGAFVCSALNLISILADHLDESEGERMYHVFARATQVAGWVLFAGAIILSLFPASRNHW
jgi:hypothetical protein